MTIVSLLQRGRENLFDIGGEARAVDWPVEDARRVDPVASQCGDEGQRFPVAVRHFRLEPDALGAPPADRRHVGFRPGLIDENQPRRIDPRLIAPPAFPPARHVRPILLAGEHGFF